MHDPRTPDQAPLDAVAIADAARGRRTAAADKSAVTLPIVAESIHVEKVEVDRGGYRITKHIEAREVVVDEQLRHETVEIERRPLNRELADGEVPAARYDGDTLIVPVVKEIVVTQVRRILVEEVRIARVAGTHRDPQSVTLREEHIEIERLGAEASVIKSS